MTVKTIYEVAGVFEVHAIAPDLIWLEVAEGEPPYALALDDAADLINALEMAYSDALDLQEAQAAPVEVGSNWFAAELASNRNNFNPFV